jgi:hypothetical protein
VNNSFLEIKWLNFVGRTWSVELPKKWKFSIYIDKFVKNYKYISRFILFCYKLSFSFPTYENITFFFAIFAALWKMLLLQVWAAFPL